MGSINRITGLSGLDTQSMVDQMMQAARKPLDKLLKQRQLLSWKQEAYQAQNTAITQLKEMLFKLKLQSSYNSKQANTSDAKVATATAYSTAPLSSYVLEVERLATVATNKSAQPLSIRSSVAGKDLDFSTPITIDATNNQFTVVLDGIATDITLDNGDYNSLADLAAAIQTKLDAGGFADPVYVKASSGGELVFGVGQKSDGGVHTLALKDAAANSALSALGFISQDNSKSLTGNVLAVSGMQPIVINATSNTFKMTAGSVTQTITIADGSYTSHADFASAVENAIRGAFGVGYDVEAIDGQLRIVNRNDAPVSIKLESGGLNDALTKMGFLHGVVSDYPKITVNTAASLWDMRDRFLNNSFFADKIDKLDPVNHPGKNSAFGFTINGQSFSCNVNESLDAIIQQINANTSAGVMARYDEFADRLILTTTKTGNNNEGGEEIDFYDPDGFLSQLMGMDRDQETGGLDAQLTINGVYTEKKTNSFVMDNIGFTIIGEGTTTISVSSNIEGVTAQIEEFVTKYNEIIGGIHGELTESRAQSGKYTYYEPLTEEEKKTLNEEQIKAWEEKAKQGILRSDAFLYDAVSQLRTSLSRSVYTPRTISGFSLSGVVDFTGGNTFKLTYGQQILEISLAEASYDLDTTAGKNNFLKDLQSKLDMTFGMNAIKVEMKYGSINLTSNNVAMKLEESDFNNGLNRLGFFNGASVTATYNKFTDIGISFSNDWKENGKLSFDKETFAAALQKDPDGVMNLLTNNGEFNAPVDMTKDQKNKEMDLRKGVFYKMEEMLTEIIGERIGNYGARGGLNGKKESLDKQLENLNKNINTKEDWLSDYENRLWRRFSAMEAALNKYNAQMQYITNTLGGGY